MTGGGGIVDVTEGGIVRAEGIEMFRRHGAVLGGGLHAGHIAVADKQVHAGRIGNVHSVDGDGDKVVRREAEAVDGDGKIRNIRGGQTAFAENMDVSGKGDLRPDAVGRSGVMVARCNEHGLLKAFELAYDERKRLAGNVSAVKKVSRDEDKIHAVRTGVGHHGSESGAQLVPADFGMTRVKSGKRTVEMDVARMQNFYHTV